MMPCSWIDSDIASSDIYMMFDNGVSIVVANKDLKNNTQVISTKQSYRQRSFLAYYKINKQNTNKYINKKYLGTSSSSFVRSKGSTIVAISNGV